MKYKVKVAVCSEIHTKHSKQSERHVEFLNVKPGGTGKKPLGFKRLNNTATYIRTYTKTYIHNSCMQTLIP